LGRWGGRGGGRGGRGRGEGEGGGIWVDKVWVFDWGGGEGDPYVRSADSSQRRERS